MDKIPLSRSTYYRGGSPTFFVGRETGDVQMQNLHQDFSGETEQLENAGGDKENAPNTLTNAVIPVKACNEWPDIHCA